MELNKILLPMKNITDLQPKTSITRGPRQNTCLAQEPVSTYSATKQVVETLEVKYKKQIFQPK
jgi:hypothetical protein